MADTTDKAVTRESIVKSQTSYKGSSQADLEEVKFIKDTDFYKKDAIDHVHPTTAAIFRERGLIK